MTSQPVKNGNAATCLTGMAVLLSLYLTSRYNYLLFHSLVEIFSVVIACGIFMIAANTRRFLGNNYFIFTGVAYLFIGGIDLLHALAYKNMGVFPGFDANLPTQLWIAARYLQGLSLLAAPLFLSRRLNFRHALLGYALTLALLLLAIFYWDIFPDCFVEGAGLTPFKKISEVIIIFLLAAALLVMLRKRREFHPDVVKLLSTSIVLLIVAELAFTLYVDVYGISNMAGHFAKTIAFYFIYLAMIETGLSRPYDLLFRELQLGKELLEQRVAERTAELHDTVTRLEGEIIEREMVEEELRKSLAEIHDLYNNAPCGYHSLDKNGLIIKINDTELKLLGYSRDEVVGKLNFADVLTPASRAAFRQNFPIFKERGFVYDLEYDLVRKDGSLMAALLSATAVTDQENSYEASRSTIHDITDLKLAREALYEKEQQLIHQSRLAAMGEMIGNIAHQWRQPLNILGLTIQQMRLAYEHNAFSREFLHKSVTASMELINHMSGTIDDFRNYFKPDKEKVEFAVQNAVTNTLSLLQASFLSQQISIEVVARENPVIHGYPNEFTQVLLNIMNNAKDALIGNGVAPGKIIITIGTENNRAVVTIADNGCGIAEEIIGKIFDPYFTTKDPQSGTGVGLYMAKTIIEKGMGGKLSARNVAAGAEFRIEIDSGVPADRLPASSG